MILCIVLYKSVHLLLYIYIYIYLSLEDVEEFFYNDLYFILYNKKFIIYLFVKHFYQIKLINEFWIILFNIIKEKGISINNYLIYKKVCLF